MENITVQMPIVSKCEIVKCFYHSNNTCHAKAITIGDGQSPGCDTYMDSVEKKIILPSNTAGVGACKVGTCKFNEDYECISDKISVGLKNMSVECLTFEV